ncbi:hypothetical protein AMTR_s00011p00070060 [Amborella trichopoda]|uniref:Uncharacterized protein n=1 Tax=Amborella trichopoda TaxID=13333 RepID=W1NFK1_AMBTC|nr:hypothetical protein AMTR_s00011p00070060 [Amborella trichopoda]
MARIPTLESRRNLGHMLSLVVGIVKSSRDRQNQHKHYYRKNDFTAYFSKTGELGVAAQVSVLSPGGIDLPQPGLLLDQCYPQWSFGFTVGSKSIESASAGTHHFDVPVGVPNSVEENRLAATVSICAPTSKKGLDDSLALGGDM